MIISFTSEIPAEKAAPLQRQSRYSELLWVLPFIVLYLVQLLHHQLWRDELNAWGISAAAPNLKVLYSYIRYEGHPALWYLLLWPLSHLTTAPAALKAVEGVIGIAVYLTLARYAPFPLWQKLLLYMAYFISFEYTVFARMYGLMLLLCLLYLHARTTGPERYVRNSILLALMANTETIGFILAFALAVEYAWEQFRVKGRMLLRDRSFQIGVTIYALGVLTTAIALRISPHITQRERVPLFAEIKNVKHLVQAVVSTFAAPWLAINPDYPANWWNVYLYKPLEHPIYIGTAVLIAGAYCFIFWGEWAVLQIIATTALGAIALNHLIYMGSLRHFGITFLAFLAALWIERYRTSRTNPLAVLLLAFTAAVGMTAAFLQWTRPFSQGPNTVNYLRQEGLDRETLLITPDTAGAEIGVLLRKPFYALDCNCANTFLLYSNQRDNFGPINVPERLWIAQRNLHRSEFTLITIYPIVGQLAHDLSAQQISFKLLRSFTGAEEAQENYYVYRVVMPPQAPRLPES